MSVIHKRCDYCHHREQINGVRPLLICRRYPPMFDPETRKWVWPGVEPDDWCGEFKP
jgi:Fe-S-cluster containining protein